MNPDLELTSRLDALGRNLSMGVPLDPPDAFMAGVRAQHRATMITRTVVGAAALAVLTSLVYFAASYRPAPSPRPPEPNYGELRTVPADDLDDTPLPPGDPKQPGR